MKKIFFNLILAASFVSCSSESEDPILNPKETPIKLVDATIPISMCESATTRSYLGQAHYDKSTNSTYVYHDFESSDIFVVCDYLGQYDFKVTDGLGQSTSISGQWAELSDDAVLNGITVLIPKSATKETAINVVDQCPTMHFKLPVEQTTRYYTYDGGEGGEITYQREAGLGFACSTKKTGNLSFFPVVSYLYFKSFFPDCVISGTGIAGDTYDVTYTAKASTGSNQNGTTEFTSVEGIAPYLKYSSNANSIVCHGYNLEHHTNTFGDFSGMYEYVVCVRPGDYASKNFKIYTNTSVLPTGDNAKSFHNKSAISLIPGILYYFGCVDKQFTLSASVVKGSESEPDHGKVSISPEPNAGSKYYEGTSVVLTAAPEDGYRVKEWKKNNDVITGDGLTQSFRVSANDNYSVEFKQLEWNNISYSRSTTENYETLYKLGQMQLSQYDSRLVLNVSFTGNVLDMKFGTMKEDGNFVDEYIKIENDKQISSITTTNSPAYVTIENPVLINAAKEGNLCICVPRGDITQVQYSAQ